MAYERILISDNADNEGSKKETVNFQLYFSVFIVNLLMLANGTIIAWTGMILPRLRSKNIEINPLERPITTLEASLIAGIPYIGFIITCFLVGKVSEKLGRKQCIIYFAIGILCLVTTLAFSKNINMYYICLLLISACQNLIFINTFIYVSEISENSNRGSLGCIAGVVWPLGVVVLFTNGMFTTKYASTLICAVPVSIFLLLSYFLVESPSYLIMKGKNEKALTALQYLRPHKSKNYIENELAIIHKSLKQLVLKKVGFLDLFKTKASKKASLISFIILVTQQLSGILVIEIHLPTIFTDAGLSISGEAVTIGINLTQAFTVMMVGFLVDRFGKRPLLLISSACCAFLMFILSMYFYMKRLEFLITEKILWLPVVCTLFIIVTYCIGLGALSVVVVSELYPSKLKAVGIGINMIVADGLMFLVGFTFPLISNSVGIHVCMWVYSVSTVIGFVIMYFILPETMGKSPVEIENILSS